MKGPILQETTKGDVMKRTVVICAVILHTINAYAETFDIGGTEIVIPPPEGFTIVTQEMDAVYRLNLRMEDPNNDQLAYYISDMDVPAAINGEIPSLEKTSAVKVNKQIKNIIIGLKDFKKFKNKIKLQNKEKIEEIKSRASDIFEKTNKGISEEFDINFAMGVNDVTPLDPHFETENILSYSMYANYGASIEQEKKDVIVSSTTTFVNVAGKILFLYCYGPQNEIEWTREVSKLWAEKIVSSNPDAPVKSTGIGGIDWRRVILKGITGGISGGIIALLIGMATFFKKKPK
jgi:hypothetical protein